MNSGFNLLEISQWTIYCYHALFCCGCKQSESNLRYGMAVQLELRDIYSSPDVLSCTFCLLYRTSRFILFFLLESSLWLPVKRRDPRPTSCYAFSQLELLLIMLLYNVTVVCYCVMLLYNVTVLCYCIMLLRYVTV